MTTMSDDAWGWWEQLHGYPDDDPATDDEQPEPHDCGECLDTCCDECERRAR